MYFLTLWDEITDAAVGALRSLSLSLCDIIYRLIVFCFNVFEKIGTAKLLSDETIQVLYEKVGLILGIYMIFRLTFVGVQYVLDPDAMTDKVKGTGNLIKKIILVIVLLGITPFIFSCAYYVQDAVVQEGILSKFILGTDGNTENFGGELSWYLFSTFYRKTELEISNTPSCIELESGLIENDFINNHSLKYTYNCINSKGVYSDIENGETETYVIDFEGLIAIIAGGAVLWMIVMYTVSVGFRLIQLAFLQLIAPIPIMMYLEPKSDGPFQKWVKQCVSCYLDYFIRTVIIYFIVFLVQSIMNSDSSYFYETLNGVTEKEYRYIIVIVILGLLTFAKKLPELLKDILPSSGSGLSDYGLSFKKRADNMVGGSYINKGYDKLKGAAKAVGLMPLSTGQKVISGIDSAAHGKGFWNGFTRHPGKFGQWLNKQREDLTPEAYKASQERREGRENVSAIDDKWSSGVKIAQNLMHHHGFTGTSGANPWSKALDGVTRSNYSLIFKHEEFANSKFAVDQASNAEEELRYIQQALNSGSTATFTTASGATYNSGNAQDLAEALDKAQKKLKGLEEVHTEISKQYQDDAKIEKQFKFIKNNESNPANPGQNHTSNGIS